MRLKDSQIVSYLNGCNGLIRRSVVVFCFACRFVVYDTQLAVAQFDMGNRDYLMHALQFYVNFVSIFLRLVAILSERQEEANRRKRDGRSD